MVIHSSGLNLFLYLRDAAREIIHTLHRIECLVFNRTCTQKLGSVHYMMGSSISSILVQVYTVLYGVDCRVYTVLYILLLRGLRVSVPLWEVYVS